MCGHGVNGPRNTPCGVKCADNAYKWVKCAVFAYKVAYKAYKKCVWGKMCGQGL